MRRLVSARLATLAAVSIVFGLQLGSHVFHELNRTLRGPAAAEVLALARSLPDRVRVVDLAGAEEKAGGPTDLRLPLPQAWILSRDAGPEPPRSLLVFVNGRRVPHFLRDPAETRTTPYAFYRSRRGTALFIRCPAGMTCAQAIIAPSDWRLSARLLQSRLARFPGHAVLVLLGLVGWTGVAAWAAGSWSAARMGWATGAALLALVLWLGLTLQATAWAIPILVLETAALGSSWIRHLASTIRRTVQAAWSVGASDRHDAPAWLARAFLLAAVSCAVAVPHVLTGLSWYPTDQDDSFLYLRGASRLLAAGSLFRGVADPAAWEYSIYPLALAALSRMAGVHPMIAYKWVGHAGAVLLPAALGIFAYAVTRRLRTAVLACVIGGLWGGLAGYLWLAREGVPALVRLQPPPLLNDDYFEPRFLGEYAGPHSELTAYVCRTPLYPREAGLLLFWPALGLLYGGLPRPSVGRILAFALLVVSCTAVYPYYGIPGLLVLVAVTFQEARGSPSADERKRFWTLLVLLATAMVVVLAVANHMVRLYKWPAGLLGYLGDLWRRPIEDIAPSAPVRFTLGRILSGHFFMAAAVALAWRLRSHRKGEWTWAGWPLFLTSLALSCLAGILARWSFPGRFLDPYGWIVPWRTLVEPVIVLGAALSVGVILDHLRRQGRSYLAVPLLLVPAVSPLHWTLNADRYLREAAELPWGRGKNRAFYDEYARLGTALLGRLKLREPVLVEAKHVGPLEAALGVRAVGSVAQHEPLVVYPELQGVLVEKMASGAIGDLAVVPGGAFERRMTESKATTPLARFGPYAILRAAPSRGAP